MSSSQRNRPAPLPQFAPPPERPLDPPLPEVEGEEPSHQPSTLEQDQAVNADLGEGGLGDAARGMLGKAKRLLAPRPMADRTPTSQDGEWQPDKAAALFAGLVTAAISLGALLIRLRTQGHGQLRRPTSDELDDIADPLGRMFFRRVDLERWGPDLVDAVMLVSATSAYASNGPLIEPASIDAGLPETGEPQ